MRLIENYSSTSDVTTQFAGRTYPGISLVEDDEGIRWLLSVDAAGLVHAPTWARAVAAGAAGILVPGGQLLDQSGVPQRHRAITTERFAEVREEVPPYYTIPAEAWSFFDHVPTYPEVYESRPGSLLVVPDSKLSGFVHLHTHSEYSPLDGLSKIPEIVDEVVRHGQQAVAVTDHGYCSGHPQLQKVTAKAGIKPIFGIEAYFQDDRLLRSNPENTKEENHAIRFGYYHLILLAMNETGLHNLWAMSTESFRDGFYDKKPRMDWDTLKKHSEGVIASSACLRGPVSKPVLDDDEGLARRNLSRLLDIFGDRFYLEIQPNQLAEQEKVNRALVTMAKDYGVPLVATVDSHYPTKGDHPAHEAWVALQTNSDVNDEGDLFAVNLDLYVQSEEEARKGLAYLGQDVVDESIANTVAIAEKCSATIGGKPAAPVYSKKGGSDRDAERLLEMCVLNWHKTSVKEIPQDEYMARFEREFDLLRKKGFCFPAGTQVTMGDGSLRAIESIAEGDFVLTRNGAEPVGRTMVRQVDEDLVSLRVAGSYRRLEGTGNHPVLTPTGWKDMSEIQVGDEVLVESVPVTSGAPFDLAALARAQGWDVREQDGRFVRMGPGRWGTPRVKKGGAPSMLEPTRELLYVLGLWVAEGHVYDPDGPVNPAQIGWTLHQDEVMVRDRLIKSLDVMGLGQARVYAKVSACSPEHKGVTVMLTNHPFALFLREQFGSGVRGKSLCPWIMGLPDALLESFVQGWFDGDGTTSRNKSIIDCVNPTLVSQLRSLLLRAGIWTTETSFLRTGDGVESYRVIWTNRRTKAPYGARREGSRWWVKVKNVDVRPHHGAVYNLSVAGDPTYLANGIRVHNCGYFLMVADYCRYAKESGILVGPGRGSGAGSLVAYLCDITEVDPLEADLPFERFMTEGRTSLPDFDVDFPASKKGVMLKYLRDKYGEQYVISIGTHLKLKSKGIIKDLGRSMMSVLTASERAQIQQYRTSGEMPHPSVMQGLEEALQQKTSEVHKDLAAVSKIVTEAEAGTAGLGMSWDDLWAQFGEDLQPYRDKYPELFTMADKLVGRMKTYGKHAAGIIISTDRPLTGWLPLSAGEEGDQMVSQFDMVALEEIGLVKFDILTIRTLDTVQMAVDLIQSRRDTDVEIYSWKEEYRDPAVWERVAAADTLGMFQIETKSGTRLCQRMGPLNLSELSDMITIVRPGPMRSGLTETYLRRRAGQEPITFPDPRMEQVLGPTFGCMIYQEQIMQACILLAGYSSDEADNVRKILGKKKVEQIGPAGQEFVSRAVEWGSMQREAAQHLWDQMAEFAKYSFNKAHAYSYTMITYWLAWLKIHYPIEFFVACLSTIDQDRIPEFIKEVRRTGYTVLPPDVNSSGKGFKAEPLAVRYGLDSIKGIGEKAVEDLVEGQLYTTLEYFEEYAGRKGSKINAGVVMLLAKVGALDSLEPNRAGLVTRLEAQKAGLDTRCVWKDDSRVYQIERRERIEGETDEQYAAWETAERATLPPNSCIFDWSTEEPPINPRNGKKMALKPLPKRCTRACRQYTAPAPMRLADVPSYTDEQIRSIEHELLGVFLSSSPFDRLDPEDRRNTREGAEGLREGGSGRYMVSAIVMGARKTRTRASQEEMAFLTLDTEVDTVEVAVFPKTWATIKETVTAGRLCYAVVKKDDQGVSLSEIAMI